MREVTAKPSLEQLREELPENTRLIDFDEVEKTVITRDEFTTNLPERFDHHRWYFLSRKGAKARVTFAGSGKVDILSFMWNVPGTRRAVVEKTTVKNGETFEFGVPEGRAFEPRVYAGSEIGQIVLENIDWFWWQKTLMGLGAVGGVGVVGTKLLGWW